MITSNSSRVSAYQARALSILRKRLRMLELRKERLIAAVCAEDNTPNCLVLARRDLDKVDVELEQLRSELARRTSVS
jgi:hypothetical protein